MESVNAVLPSTAVRFSNEYLLPLVICSAISYILIYYVSPFLSAKYVPFYKTLDNFEKGDWNTRTISSIHAAVISIISIYLAITDEAINSDKIRGTSKEARFAVCITCGFILADWIAMLRWFPLSESWIYMLHHFGVLYPFINNVVYGVLTYFAVFRIMSEFSTPFVNLRWFLSTLGHRSSKLYLINGILMTAAFFLCRIVVIPIYYVAVYHDIDKAISNIPLALLICWLPCGVLMDSLNVYWFVKILKGIVGMIRSSGQPEGEMTPSQQKGE